MRAAVLADFFNEIGAKATITCLGNAHL